MDLLYVRMRRGNEDKLFTTNRVGISSSCPILVGQLPVNDEEWQISWTRKKEEVHLKLQGTSQKGSYGRETRTLLHSGWKSCVVLEWRCGRVQDCSHAGPEAGSQGCEGCSHRLPQCLSFSTWHRGAQDVL